MTGREHSTPPVSSREKRRAIICEVVSFSLASNDPQPGFLNGSTLSSMSQEKKSRFYCAKDNYTSYKQVFFSQVRVDYGQHMFTLMVSATFISSAVSSTAEVSPDEKYWEAGIIFPSSNCRFFTTSYETAGERAERLISLRARLLGGRVYCVRWVWRPACLDNTNIWLNYFPVSKRTQMTS